MTREDAVKELSVEYFGDSEKIREAKKMAIKALSAEPCEDCISRAEAIKALEYDLSVEADGGLDKYRTVIKDLLNAIYNTQKKAIEDLPSIQPKPKTDFEHKAEIVISQLRADRDRLQDAIEKIKAEIDDATEIHSDGEFYIKNIDVKRIIDKYKAESEEI